ncbi:hypothetical protein AF335_04590 [Streptomyces eurocidicus]|uniref:DUF4097 domain-containing protein n=1 Tax=Streptomyces eurocidicus TaxID=66423 RepID=A0A2N8P3J6_STREU|nr:DUF4097 family beta strand repeat-containing protein [Streptomyces eurocidicus]MBB5117804.1 hypothetical protein [Streptomyces eurocidicus]MBF6055630.1 DUF4097 family beta strand repeat protein [Streptomyces eurocidicus]PNE35589.1 hypothetical protein AF335_04590 [Streptomyces eurocidicus]
MTERAFISKSSGPVVLGLDLPVGSIHVQVLAGVATAHVVVRTDDPSGPAADAVDRARMNQIGQALSVEIPEIPGNVMTQSIHGGRVIQSVGTVTGSVTGMTIVNGRIIHGGGTGTLETVSPIEVRVVLPAGSSLAVVTTSAHTTVAGTLERAEFRSVSADLDLDGARSLSAVTTSGDILIGHLAEGMSARSVSGDIRVESYSGSGATAKTTSGDVVARATGRASGPFRATSVSGDIRLSGSDGLRVSAHSLSGRVRTR